LAYSIYDPTNLKSAISNTINKNASQPQIGMPNISESKNIKDTME
jgi:hypothetical protein